MVVVMGSYIACGASSTKYVFRKAHFLFLVYRADATIEWFLWENLNFNSHTFFTEFVNYKFVIAHIQSGSEFRTSREFSLWGKVLLSLAAK